MKRLLHLHVDTIVHCLQLKKINYFSFTQKQQKLKSKKKKSSFFFFLFSFFNFFFFSQRAQFLFEAPERIVCISATDDTFSIVCEGSVVYQFLEAEEFQKANKLDFFLDKKINHVSSTYSLVIFASLYNENKEDDKIYNLKENNIEELKIDEIVGEQRIINIYSGGASIYILLGFIFYFFYFLILIFYLIFLIIFFYFIYFLIFIFIIKDNGKLISFGSNGNGALGRETKEQYDFIDDGNMKNEKIVMGCAQYYGSILLCFSKDNPCKFYGFGYNTNGYF